jgi:hypothetical protein
MNKEIFLNYMRFPELLDDRSVQGIRNIVEEYPFFQSARLLYIKNLHNQGSLDYEKNLRLTAVYIPDRSRLFYLLDQRALFPNTENWSDIAAEMNASDEIIDFAKLTEATPVSIDESDKPGIKTPTETLEDIILSGISVSTPFFNVDDKVDIDDFKKSFRKNPAKPSTHEKTESVPQTRKDNLIDKFILSQPRIVPNENKDQEQKDISLDSTSENPELITDTLAKIYIKQGLYEKALMAYEKLSLKYPEKNIYFAAQIKKIKQLLNNQ